MRSVLLGAAVSLVLCRLPVLAEDDVMAARYGNTTDSVDAQGIHTKIYYSADHSFKAAIAAMQVHGTWRGRNRHCLSDLRRSAREPAEHVPEPDLRAGLGAQGRRHLDDG